MNLGNCKYCGNPLCKESVRPDNTHFIGCSNCSYIVELIDVTK